MTSVKRFGVDELKPPLHQNTKKPSAASSIDTEEVAFIIIEENISTNFRCIWVPREGGM